MVDLIRIGQWVGAQVIHQEQPAVVSALPVPAPAAPPRAPDHYRGRPYSPFDRAPRPAGPGRMPRGCAITRH